MISDDERHTLLELLVRHVELEIVEDLVASALLGLVRRQIEDDLAGVGVVDPGEGVPLVPHPGDLALAGVALLRLVERGKTRRLEEALHRLLRRADPRSAPFFADIGPRRRQAINDQRQSA